MAQTFLIVGNSSKLSIDLAHEALSQKNQVLLTVEPNSETPAIPSGLETGMQYVEWNRRSPISARFVLLQAINQQVDIDHAVLVFSPQNEKTSVHELSSSLIEEKLDFDCKGYLFILKELVNYFYKRKQGSITFLYHNPGPEVLPPMEAILEGSFLGLAQSMFTYYENEPLVLRGIQSRLTQQRQISEYVLQTIKEDHPRNRNKWLKYTGKSGIFNFSR